MGTIALNPGLRAEYEHLFKDCRVRPERAAEIERTVDRLLQHRTRYDAVALDTGVPWHVVAVIHCLETGVRFDRHLHNGDPLTARTVRVPAGRPRHGHPPFAWEESARDALALKRLGAATDWSLAGTLYQLERYNGFGYRLHRPHVRSPYLWSFSHHYARGKYVADGRWSDTAVSHQCGAAVLLRRMAERDVAVFEDQPPPAPGADRLVVAWSRTRSRDPEVVASAEALQRWLNTFPGIFLRVDGHAGDRTSEAFRKVTGAYLPGDPRAALDARTALALA